MVLVMLGLGKAYYKGELYTGEEALKKQRLSLLRVYLLRKG